MICSSTSKGSNNYQTPETSGRCWIMRCICRLMKPDQKSDGHSVDNVALKGAKRNDSRKRWTKTKKKTSIMAFRFRRRASTEEQTTKNPHMLIAAVLLGHDSNEGYHWIYHLSRLNAFPFLLVFGTRVARYVCYAIQHSQMLGWAVRLQNKVDISMVAHAPLTRSLAHSYTVTQTRVEYGLPCICCRYSPRNCSGWFFIWLKFDARFDRMVCCSARSWLCVFFVVGFIIVDEFAYAKRWRRWQQQYHFDWVPSGSVCCQQLHMCQNVCN